MTPPHWRNIFVFSIVMGAVYTLVFLGAAGFFEAVP
jgi:hypothetical protein